jgi:hypothetical protein
VSVILLVVLLAGIYFTGSEQEFDETRILGRFLDNHEFGLGHCHALGLE